MFSAPPFRSRQHCLEYYCKQLGLPSALVAGRPTPTATEGTRDRKAASARPTSPPLSEYRPRPRPGGSAWSLVGEEEVHSCLTSIPLTDELNLQGVQKHGPSRQAKTRLAAACNRDLGEDDTAVLSLQSPNLL